MMEQPNAIQRLQWEAERLVKSCPRVRLMVSRGSRWIGGCGPWDDIAKNYIPTSWSVYLRADQVRAKHLFTRNYHVWIASTSVQALGECCELAFAVSGTLLSHSAPEPLGAFGAHFGRFQGNEPEASEVSVFAALAEAAADGVVFTQQRERVHRNLQYAGDGFGIRVSEVAGSFGAVKTVPNYERYFAGWDDPDAGYFMEPLRDVNSAIASVLQRAAQATSASLSAQASPVATPSGASAWTIERIEAAERLGKLPPTVLAAVILLGDKSKEEVKLQVVVAALKETSDNVRAALVLLKEWDHEMSQSNVYRYRKMRDARALGLAAGLKVSKMDGKLEGMHMNRSRRKSGEHKG